MHPCELEGLQLDATLSCQQRISWRLLRQKKKNQGQFPATLLCCELGLHDLEVHSQSTTSIRRWWPQGLGQDHGSLISGGPRYGVTFGTHGCGRDRCGWLASTSTDELRSNALLLTFLIWKETINRPLGPRSISTPLLLWLSSG